MTAKVELMVHVLRCVLACADQPYPASVLRGHFGLAVFRSALYQGWIYETERGCIPSDDGQLMATTMRLLVQFPAEKRFGVALAFTRGLFNSASPSAPSSTESFEPTTQTNTGKQTDMSNETDADFHAGPMNERIVQAPWHTSLYYDGAATDSLAHERMVAIPDYDTMDPAQDGYFVRVDTLQVNEDGEASATSILWDVRELARFCQETLAVLGADHAIERAVMAENAEAAEGEDEEGEDEEGEDEEGEDEEGEDEEGEDEEGEEGDGEEEEEEEGEEEEEEEEEEASEED